VLLSGAPPQCLLRADSAAYSRRQAEQLRAHSAQLDGDPLDAFQLLRGNLRQQDPGDNAHDHHAHDHVASAPRWRQWRRSSRIRDRSCVGASRVVRQRRPHATGVMSQSAVMGLDSQQGRRAFLSLAVGLQFTCDARDDGAAMLGGCSGSRFSLYGHFHAVGPRAWQGAVISSYHSVDNVVRPWRRGAVVLYVSHRRPFNPPSHYRRRHRCGPARDDGESDRNRPSMSV